MSVSAVLDALERALAALPADKTLVVAYSGGMDSHVLLDALVQWRHVSPAACQRPMQALHINHGLQSAASHWEAHCRQVCASLSVPFACDTLSLGTLQANLEARAREARYAAFEARLGPGDILLQGHHLDDQIESSLYALMRGRGLKGLAGMPTQRPLGRGQLCRPLLDLPRASLLAYARERQLVWVEDPSNHSLVHDRNYLRQCVLPLLQTRWPGLGSSWQKSRQVLLDAEANGEYLAWRDLESMSVAGSTCRLSLSALARLPASRQRNALHHWLHTQCQLLGAAPPGFHAVQRVQTEMMTAAADAQPELPLGTALGVGQTLSLKRHGDTLFLLAAAPEGEPGFSVPLEQGQALLGPVLGSVRLRPAEQYSRRRIDTDRLAGRALRIAWPVPGLQCRAAGRQQRSFSKWCQDFRVPVWLRPHLPLLYADDELVAVADLFVLEGWQAGDKKGSEIQWLRSDLHCGY